MSQLYGQAGWRAAVHEGLGERKGPKYRFSSFCSDYIDRLQPSNAKSSQARNGVRGFASTESGANAGRPKCGSPRLAAKTLLNRTAGLNTTFAFRRGFILRCRVRRTGAHPENHMSGGPD